MYSFFFLNNLIFLILPEYIKVFHIPIVKNSIYPVYLYLLIFLNKSKGGNLTIFSYKIELLVKNSIFLILKCECRVFFKNWDTI